MKSPNIFTEINKEKGIFFSAALSLVLHISIFVVNPIFSFIIFDTSDEGQFMAVEFVNAEEKGSEEAESSTVPKISQQTEKDNNEKAASIAEDKPISEATPEDVRPAPVIDAENQDEPIEPETDQTPAQEEQNVEVTEAATEEEKIEPLPAPTTSSDPDFTEKETITDSYQPETAEETAISDQMTQADVAGPMESPVGLQGEQVSEAVFVVKEDAEDQLFAAVANNETPVQTSVYEPIKDNQVRDKPETEMKKEEPAAESEPPAVKPEQPAPKAPAVSEIVKEESQKGSTGSKGAPDAKQEEVVKKAETESAESAVDAVRPESPKVEPFQELNVEEKKEEPVKNVEQQIVEEKSLPKEELPVHEIPASVKKAEEMKIAEKMEEPAKITEQKAERPLKKKKLINPFHKVVEPGKEAVIGMPVGKPFIQITSPAKGKTNSRVRTVSGRVQGKGVTRVILSVNGGNTTVPVQNGRFLWDAALRDGKNTISGTVWDIDGNSASDKVMVEVLPPKNGFQITIDEPGSEIESPVAKVKGRIEDAAVESVRLIVNGEIIEAAVDGGFFEKTVLFKERENILEAEALKSASVVARSEPVAVTVKNPLVSDILIHVIWSDIEDGPRPALLWKERFQLENGKEARKEADMVELMSAAEGYGEKIFSVRKADGAYALKISGGKETDCKLVVTLNPSKKIRVFEKRLMTGEEWFVGRFLMPEGVFWDEDEWFTGSIEGSDSMTKYKSPEGVTWKELK